VACLCVTVPTPVALDLAEGPLGREVAAQTRNETADHRQLGTGKPFMRGWHGRQNLLKTPPRAALVCSALGNSIVALSRRSLATVPWRPHSSFSYLAAGNPGAAMSVSGPRRLRCSANAAWQFP
jgi:hypothetical protein